MSDFARVASPATLAAPQRLEMHWSFDILRTRGATHDLRSTWHRVAAPESQLQSERA